jgi:ParB family chromosome partitioning protein
MQLAVRHKTISMGHARALIAIDDPQWQQRVFERIQDEGLSVRAVEELARVKRQPQKPAHSTNKLLLTFDEQQVQADLKLKFGKSSKLKRTPSGGGKIELTYGDASELEELLKKLGI